MKSIEKKFKYEQNLEKYKKIIKMRDEESWVMLLQINGLSGKNLIKLIQYVQLNNMELLFLNNIVKKKILQLGFYEEALLNNELVLIKGQKKLIEIFKIMSYLEQPELKKNILIINFIICYNENKLAVKNVNYYERFVKNVQQSNSFELLKEVHNIIKFKLLVSLVNFKQVLNAYIQSIKK